VFSVDDANGPAAAVNRTDIVLTVDAEAPFVDGYASAGSRLNGLNEVAAKCGLDSDPSGTPMPCGDTVGCAY
jgi:hypothetical protein